MTSRTYETPGAFKQALEQRLRSSSTTGTDFVRRRQLLVFDRFLARVGLLLGDAVTLKGGLALEFRLERARTTKDVDLRLTGSSDEVLARLQQAGRIDLGEYMTFEVVPDAHQPEIRKEGMRYDGLRYRAECHLARRLYGHPFGVDVAFGDPIVGERDVVIASDVLGFAGIEPPKLKLYPLESHIAEKLHAYTMPRARPNSRLKDLPDLALLATVRTLDGGRLRRACEGTFAFRDTHPLPACLPDPPTAWTASYAAMARENGLPWDSLGRVVEAVRAFLDPVLGGELPASWWPRGWSWTAVGDEAER